MIKSNNTPAVLGIGNALMDIITQVEDDSLLQTFGLPRGSMTLVDAELSQNIFNATLNNKKEVTNGGSAANTMRCLASLGGNGGYIGKTGDDELGKIFKDEFTKKGIKTHMALSEKDTGRVMGLISKDSERTMATYLGAAAELLPSDLDSSLLKGYRYFYMEGYLVQNHDLIKTGFEMAKAQGLTTAIDLASYNVVEANLDFLKELITDKVDIVFANEEEALALTGKSPEEALEEIAEICDLAVVKVGKEGSFVKKGNEKIKIHGIPAKAIDTTGAGDSYAAGFLYGLTQGFPLEKCGNIASMVAGKVVEVWGPNLPDATWDEINKKIREMN
ncbi:adenosine kinase [Maribellus comscasis]|uniref:Adenosine kinase n=1 Tax=Maribellus comscasis TaxID=2681766 RepID=A0A6I6JUV3_9BACT|nr:adenosine kinase [Maribellus comscasis]QGY43957.1 adenosine kinase [Maribellus comscasis]